MQYTLLRSDIYNKACPHITPTIEHDTAVSLIVNSGEFVIMSGYTHEHNNNHKCNTGIYNYYKAYYLSPSMQGQGSKQKPSPSCHM